MSKMKKTIALVLALILCMGTLTGCSKDYAKQVAVTVNGDKIYMDEMMYYIYIEEDMYGMYEELYQMMYGFSFWESSYDGTTTMSTTVKHEIVTMAAWYTILSQKAAETGLTLDEETTAQIQEDAQTLYDGLTESQKEKTQFTVDNLVKTLTKIKLATEFYLQTVEGYEVDREGIRAGVSKEDYRQYNIEYLAVTFTSGEEGSEVTLSEEEQKALIERVDSFKAEAEDGADLEELLDEGEEDIQYTETNFLHKDAADGGLNEAASKLKDGEVTTYRSENSYYLIRMVDNDSEEGYEAEVKKQIQEAENTYFSMEYAELANNCKIKPSRFWTKLNVGTLTAAEETETTTGEAGGEETTTEETTAEETTAAE